MKKPKPNPPHRPPLNGHSPRTKFHLTWEPSSIRLARELAIKRQQSVSMLLENLLKQELAREKSK